MSHPHASERQLAQDLIKKLPWLTLTIGSACLVIQVLVQTNRHETAFSLDLINNSTLSQLAFHAHQPLRSVGLTIASSFFVHTDWNHLFSNLIWFFICASWIELRAGKRKLALALAAGHLIALAGGLINAHINAGASFLLGMSGGVSFLSFLCLFAFQSKARAGIIFVLFWIVAAFQASGFWLTHGVPALLGAAAGLGFRTPWNTLVSAKKGNVPFHV
jgi:membrane associated rhomboid family serine protease